ncbi:hypothetical protein KCU74_g2020, partial [Aureobasidium melanogenum]
MGHPQKQAQSEVPPQSQLPPFTAVAPRSRPSNLQVTHANAPPCQSIKPHCALRDYEIVANILSYLKNEPKDLAVVLRTCSLFFQAGARILWEEGQPRDLLCIQDLRRRLEFAQLLKSLTLWNRNQICATEGIIDSTSWRLEALAVYNSGSSALHSSLIIPYLSSSLQKLTVDDGALSLGERQHHFLDQDCLGHITATCHMLSALDLDVVLDVTSRQLSQFFQSMPYLRTLRLGNYLETVLDHAAMSAVFTMPNLKRLELKPLISHQLAEGLINTTEAQQILPSVRFLEIYLTEGDSSAPGDLLRTLTTVESLTITVHNASEWPSMLHPNLCDGISNLLSLKCLNIHLDRGVDMIDQDLAALYPLENLTELGLWPLHADGDSDQDANNLHVSTPHFRDALYVLELIKSATVDLVWTGILTPDESKELHERGAAFSRYWTLQSNIISDEDAGVCDDHEDLKASEVTPDDVWKGSQRAFSPDPVPWVDRDLNIFTDKQGHILPIEEIVSDGSFNFLS